MRNGCVVALAVLLAGPAAAQGLPNIPGLGNAIPGLGRPQTPEEKRAFCGRAASAAARCVGAGGLSLDAVGLTSCLMKSMSPQDSLQLAQVAQRTGGSAGNLLGECGIGVSQ
ncbi:hypothetical protein E2C06_15045 [Dankookia rubra]|uniref:Uncharacterized protein n=1 Tax=Dankookia rubra TaxID=1442381 RepID=A0A4R5QFZ0_9PROT|nr:hypothetical protein [Dankookia rubra]TDH61843.1 hypothetical protein E2C06_15045 [Dankookia rubra]